MTKFLAFLLTGVSSMLAESIHSLADSGNQALLLLGGNGPDGRRPPEHPFGYGRERYFWAFVVAVVLFSIGGLFALYEAWHKWQHPEGLECWVWVPLVVLVAQRRPRGQLPAHRRPRVEPVTGVAQLAAVHPQRQGAGAAGHPPRGPRRPHRARLRDARGRDDHPHRHGRWDAAGTGLIGLLLVTVAVVLAVEMKSLLLGEAASVEHVHHRGRDHRHLRRRPADHLRTLHVGPEELIVAAKVAETATDTADLVASTINRAELRARQAVPDLTC